MSTKLFVGNLPDDVRRGDLRDTFEKYGEVAECDILRDFAFVHFVSEEDAKAAVKGLHNKVFGSTGTKLRVEISRSTVRTAPGMDVEGCYRCGKKGHFARDCPNSSDHSRGRDRDRDSNRDRDRDRDGDRGRSRSPPPRDPYDRYYRDYYDAYRYPPLDPLYPPRPLPPPLPPPPEYDDDPYTRPPPEYYKIRLGQMRDPYKDAYPYPYGHRGWDLIQEETEDDMSAPVLSPEVEHVPEDPLKGSLSQTLATPSACNCDESRSALPSLPPPPRRELDRAPLPVDGHPYP